MPFQYTVLADIQDTHLNRIKINRFIVQRVECSLIAWATGVQSQVVSYQRYRTRVKWINLAKRVVPSLTPRCSSYWKDSVRVALDDGYQLYFTGLVGRVFANGPGDLGSIPGWVIPKTQKMVLDAGLLIARHYIVRIKAKVEQSRERSSTVPYSSVL